MDWSGKLSEYAAENFKMRRQICIESFNYTRKFVKNVSRLSPFFKMCLEEIGTVLDGIGSSEREHGRGNFVK